MRMVTASSAVVACSAFTSEDLTKGVIMYVTFDNTNDFLFASIHEVVETLAIAIVLVLIVVLFLEKHMEKEIWLV